MLLKPDVVLRGIPGDVLKVLEDAGFGAVDFRVGSLSESLFSQMYQSTFRWDLDHWAFNRELYRYGPVIGLLLRRPANFGDTASAQEHLRVFKGSALPESLAADSLRGRLGATSRIFNVVHVPDGVDAARRDALRWFGESFIKSVKPKAQQAGAPSVPLEVEVVRHGYLLANRLDGEAIYFLVMVRLLHAIEKELGHIGIDLEALREGSASYHSGAAALLRDARDLNTRRDVIEHTLWRTRSLLGEKLRKAVAGSGHGTLLQQTLDVVVDLESQGACGGWRLEFFWHLLDQWKVFTSDLERYLIVGVFIYPSLMPFHRRSAS
jgi:nucleoside diphosphate kinase